MSGKYFSVILPLVKEYVVAGPKHYENKKWNCVTLSLEYFGQDIDLTDVDSLLMSNKEETEWLQSRVIYNKFPDIEKEVDGLKVSLMHPRVLVEYKKELDGEHQNFDIKFLEQYIKANQL